MAKIIGNTTATPNPRPDWNQTDSTKADYIKNKPTIIDNFSEDENGELLYNGNSIGGGLDVEYSEQIEANTQARHTHENIDILDKFSEVDGMLLYNESEISSASGDGATFIPSVSENGDLSWTNDKGLVNPAIVNIKGKSAYQYALDGGYEGTEEEFYSLLANMGSVDSATRPTDTVKLDDNVYTISTNEFQGALICSWGEEIPVGTEIKSIEIYTDEYGWLDLRDLATVDVEYSFYISNVHKAYVVPSENVLCFGGFMAFTQNVFGTMAVNNQITNARITYYTDGGVGDE